MPHRCDAEPLGAAPATAGRMWGGPMEGQGGRPGRAVVRPASWPRRSFLGTLPDAALRVLLGLGSQREYASNSTLIAEGDVCTDVMVLVDGWAKVVASTGGGGEALLTLRLRGDLIGTRSALENQPRSVSVISAGPAVGRVVARGPFLRFLMDWPEVGVAVSRTLSATLRCAASRNVDFSVLPVPIRLGRVLGELARLDGSPCEGGIELGCQLTQPQFAALIGASAPSVHKAMRQLRNEGVLQTRYRKIVITDTVALAAIADSGWLSPVATGRLAPV